MIEKLGTHDFSTSVNCGIRREVMTTVVAGILEQEGKILICQRREGQAHALKWEFPGGKVEDGESPEAALRRELQEELGIEAGDISEMSRYEFAYPGKNPILLIFMRPAGWRGKPENRIFRSMTWAAPKDLAEYDFLEGDLRFLRELTAD